MADNNTSALFATFTNFFNAWLDRQQIYLQQLRFLSSLNDPEREEELETLVLEVLAHYQEYYNAKATIARASVFLLFSPPWFSRFEKTFLWVTGFRPSLTVKVLEKSVGNELTTEQAAKVRQVNANMANVERVMSNEMAMLQEDIVNPPWVKLATRPEMEQSDADVDAVIDGIKARMKKLVVDADYFRTGAARDLVDILTPVQAGKFLGGIMQFHLRVRAWGQYKGANRQMGN